MGVGAMRALPGVVTASAACCVPLEGGYGLPFLVVGRPLKDGPVPRRRRLADGVARATSMSSGFPSSAAAPFTDRDTAQSPPVVVINEAMAKQFWPKGDPLSDRLVIGRGIMTEFADRARAADHRHRRQRA